MRVKEDPATRLRVFMAERDINTLELSQMTGLSRRTISCLRTGKITRPNIDTIYLISDALNVHPNDIWLKR
jgi:DNA-binding Xre family transcriptional regulator